MVTFEVEMSSEILHLFQRVLDKFYINHVMWWVE